MTSAAVRPLFQKRASARSSDPWHRCGTAPPRSTAIRLGDQRIAALSTQRTITFGPKGRPSGSPSGRGSESRNAPVSGEVNCFRFSARGATSLTLLHQAWRSNARAGSRRPTQTCLCCGTGVSSATPRAPLRADCRGPALAVGPAAERWAGRVVLVANSGSLGSRAASLAFVLAQAFAAHGVRVTPYVRDGQRARGPATSKS